MPSLVRCHNFAPGDILISIVDTGLIAQWYVQDTPSSRCVRAVLINEDGVLSGKGRVFEGAMLDALIKDPLASRLHKIHRETLETFKYAV
jgi:hypothetical protein